jgi:putative SOS response-associated peptidase YedK
LCNLYSLTKGQQAIRELAGAMSDRTGNLPPLLGIFPDYRAPIVRNQPEGRELTMARWGMPSPVFALKGRNSDTGVTNIRNVKPPHWRRWLGIEQLEELLRRFQLPLNPAQWVNHLWPPLARAHPRGPFFRRMI